MKREDVKKLLENGVLQAFAEGRPIQVFSLCSQEWLDIRGEESFFPLPAERYRVKPEPLHGWVWRQKGSIMGWTMIHSETESRMKVRFPKEAFEYRMLAPVTEE